MFKETNRVVEVEMVAVPVEALNPHLFSCRTRFQENQRILTIHCHPANENK